MKIIYISNSRIPTEKAHGIQIMEMCRAFSEMAEVDLIVPWRFSKIKQDPFVYYGAEETFKIKKIFSFDFVRFGKVGFFIQSLFFSILAAIYSLFQFRSEGAVIYSRDELVLFFLSFLKKNLFWEAHTAKRNFVIKKVIKKCRGIVAITHGLKSFYINAYGVEAKKILVAADGVDLEKFDVKISKDEARNKLDLPAGAVLIGYVGMLKTMGVEKGLGEAISALKYLSKECKLLIVGGQAEDIEFYKELAQRENVSERVLFAGKVPYQEIPLYLRSCDILIAPFPENEHYKFYMSPLKIFEYMAVKRPIIASDLPSVREILNENNAMLIKPAGEKELATAIKKISENTIFSEKISKQAFEDVKNYTWQRRVQRILDFVK